jgi:UDP-N-acetylmuramyl pentapeptide phosphotransferase/UDP-N-acetylglucosamine-1-phosphate transferase
MISILGAFTISWLLGFLILRFQNLHTRFTADHDLKGVQKFHVKAVPRIGGLAIFCGALAGLCFIALGSDHELGLSAVVIAAAIPVFISGIAEDLTKKVSVRVRMASACLSALLGAYWLNAWLVDVQFLGLDHLLAIPLFSILFTCFALAGVTNAFNLIDGYNGLASMVAVIIFCALAYVAYRVNDASLGVFCLVAAAGIAGFLFWNYPRGLFFLGDGGAYLLGFWVALCSLLLVVRNPEVSKWFPLLLCIYPVFETIFTMYRRVVLRKRSASQPDAVHLHQIIYRRAVRFGRQPSHDTDFIKRNSMTSPYLWLLASMAVLPAIIFWDTKSALQLFVVLFVALYLWLYWAIVRFRIPQFLILRLSTKSIDHQL